MALGSDRTVAMQDLTAFYATLAAAGATIFGIGAAVLSTRLAAMSERAVRLKREHGEYLNRAVFMPKEEKTQIEWARKDTRNELANLHELAARVRHGVTLQLSMAAYLVCVGLAPLAGWLPDGPLLRVAVVLLFIASMGHWIRTLHSWGKALTETTTFAHEEREKERAQLVAQGHDYFVTGDPKQLAANVDGLADLLDSTDRADLTKSWWVKLKRRSVTRRMRRAANRGRPLL